MFYAEIGHEVSIQNKTMYHLNLLKMYYINLEGIALGIQSHPVTHATYK